MQVQEIMTGAVECCTPNDIAQHAAEIMKSAHIGIVPIVADANDATVVGVVTDRDLCLAVVAAGRDPREVRLEECMSTNVLSCSPEDDVMRVADLMAENQVQRLPVLGRNGGILGMVSLSDLAERAAPTGDTLREISGSTGKASKRSEAGSEKVH